RRNLAEDIQEMVRHHRGAAAVARTASQAVAAIAANSGNFPMSGLQNLSKTFFDVEDMMNVFPTLITVGLWNTLLLSALAMLFAVICGLLLSLVLVSRSWVIRAPAFLYVDIFRGLPAILTIYLVGQG